jgi:signal transduction histidine kinase/ActR/RegA family two-component response regulator
MKIKECVLVSLGILLFHLLAHSASIASDIPRAEHGFIDLRNQTFISEVPLDGHWFFYWNQLLKPSDPGTQGAELLNFPSKWNTLSRGGKKLPAFGYASYKLTVLLPKSHGALSIAMPEVYTAYRLFLNGTVVAANGQVSTSPNGFVPEWHFNEVVIPAGIQRVVLVLQISNYAHRYGGIRKSIRLGSKAFIELKRERAKAMDFILSGCLLMAGLFFLGLYLVGNRDKAILLFSLFSIVYSYRIVGSDNYALHTILPDMSWYLAVRLEYISLFVGIGLFGLYTKYLYPKDINKIIVNVNTALCAAFSLAAACLPPIFFTQLINPFLFLMLFGLLYVPYVYARAYQRKRPGSIYTLISSLSLMCAFAISLLHYWELIPSMKVLNFTFFTAFFFLQSLILSHRVYFQLKQARSEAERGFNVKSEFLSTMSHEIRTPLNAVIGMSHLLLENKPRADQVEQLNVMVFSANNLLSIVNDILDYQKIEAGAVTFEHIEMDITAILRYIVAGMQNVAQDKGIKLLLHIDPLFHNKVIGDPTRMTQVLTNLLHNAIKFTTSGSATVLLKLVSENESSVVLDIEVSDTGIGISTEKQKMIFERFTQADSSTSRKFGGTGLGLAISKRILELQGTTLNLESTLGEGSSFFFRQMFDKVIAIPEQTQTTKPLDEKEKPLSGMEILLVEDNLMNVMVAQRYLERWGAHIEVAYNGLEGVNKLDLSKHQLVLLDLHMPVMDGYEACRKMRELGATIPIIALTANLPAEVQEQTKEAGMDDILVKPFLPDELYRMILHYTTTSLPVATL